MIYTDREDLVEGVMLASSPPAAKRGGLFATTGRKVALLAAAAVLLAVVIISIAVTVAAPRRTNTQGSNSAFGTLVVDGVGMSPYLLLDWTKRFDWETRSEVFVDGAPQILILDDLPNGEHSSNEHSSSEYLWAAGYGYATYSDGTIAYEYATNTTQDQRVSFRIDGSPYDLSMGGLFLIRTVDGVTIQQVDVDMPVFFKSDDVNYAVQTFAESNDVILAFLKDISSEQGER